ncbi:hypothetical protein DSM3645_29681 [Blastopirellula marina DSM 3645]|uniref:Uncharacterized protein n=1 Tax=Blastopirellula marina DSM 3645 TaxID=314230 RepID=A3ZXG6_9BACT|nr:hypothetical protein DSM3645_29681 [Blastopirellula marina DSM 3645]
MEHKINQKMYAFLQVDAEARWDWNAELRYYRLVIPLGVVHIARFLGEHAGLARKF